MPVQFPYPEVGWSTGRMRKRNRFQETFEQVAPPPGEMTPAQQVFERSRPDLPESASGRAVPTPSDVTMGMLMLRGPAGQVLSAADLTGEVAKSDVVKKIKGKITAWLSGDLSKKDLDTALGEHGWSVHEEGRERTAEAQ